MVRESPAEIYKRLPINSLCKEVKTMKFLKKFTRLIENKITTPIRLRKIKTSNPQGFEVIKKVRQDKLTYLSESALMDLFLATQEVSSNNQEGLIIEAGCALGGSALVIASGKNREQEFLIFDTFEMIPPPSTDDGEDSQNRWEEISSGNSKGLFGDTYYGYMDKLIEKVEDNFSRYGFPVKDNNIKLIKGLFEDTMAINKPVAMAHLDCDWYESVMTCLKEIEPNLVQGGILVIDDYEDWSGCKKAIDEYFADKKDQYVFKQISRLHIIKK